MKKYLVLSNLPGGYKKGDVVVCEYHTSDFSVIKYYNYFTNEDYHKSYDFEKETEFFQEVNFVSIMCDLKVEDIVKYTGVPIQSKIDKLRLLIVDKIIPELKYKKGKYNVVYNVYVKYDNGIEIKDPILSQHLTKVNFYYFISSKGVIHRDEEKEGYVLQFRKNSGNYFKNKELAQKHLQDILNNL